MSPSNFYDDQVKREIYAARPSPLKINKESHIIQKPSSQSSSASNSSSFSGIAAASMKQVPQQQRQQPVIIYTHSPKTIHTNVRDFMSLVQKLTGLSPSEDNEPVRVQNQSRHGSSPEGNNITTNKMNSAWTDETTSSSVVTDETCCGGITDVQVNSSPVPAAFDPPTSYLPEVSLFSPSDFFCSSRPYYRYPDSMFTPTNMSNCISPSVLECLKGFPDYCT